MNLKQVTLIEFFTALKADKRDIMPVITGKREDGEYFSEWRTNDINNVLFGVSVAGVYKLSAEGK
jgi:hypothetical protein